uniref:Putative udp-glucoronosyl and udp-glucosyl transferase n=1 Tax=Lutzomyia longipalpis TaxID=7200 RepID=A0A1B0CQD2_LUTLO
MNVIVFDNRRPYNHFLEFFMLYDWGTQSCRKALGSAALQHLLASGETFDLVITESFNTDCLLAVAHRLNAPFIGLSSCTLQPWHLDRVGIPNFPSYIPTLFMGYSEDMTFGQRLANWITLQSFKFAYKLFNDRTANSIVAEHLGPGIPDVGELAKRTSLIMVNTHYSLSGTKPLPPSVVEIGGGYLFSTHENTLDSKLDPELREFLDSADNGVIYISWGSMIRAETLPSCQTRWDPPGTGHATTEGSLERDILCHPKVRVFMTHGGLLAAPRPPTVESPYLTNAKRVSYAYRNRPKNPLDTAVWWAEHVIKTGGAPLTRSHSIHLPWYIYHSLDVIATLLVGLLTFLGAWIWFLRRIFSSGRRKQPTNRDKVKKN